jgi:hypothetical protein
VVDLPVLQMFGVASAFIAIMVLSLYVNSAVAEAQYRWPAALWAAGPFLLLWLCRLWLATARGENVGRPDRLLDQGLGQLADRRVCPGNIHCRHGR